jgi:hypothetical protein
MADRAAFLFCKQRQLVINFFFELNIQPHRYSNLRNARSVVNDVILYKGKKNLGRVVDKPSLLG